MVKLGSSLYNVLVSCKILVGLIVGIVQQLVKDKCASGKIHHYIYKVE